MIPFYFLFLIPLFFQHIRVKGFDYNKKNRLLMYFFWVVLTILLMFRHPFVGNDTQNYIKIFNRICSQNLSSVNEFSDEMGFVFLIKIISAITTNPHLFLAITSVCIILLISPTYIRLNEDTSLTIILFSIMSTFPMLFSGIRQMLAIGVGFIAYNFVRKKKLIPYLIVVIIAISFHTSAIMLLLMYPLYHLKIYKKWLFFVVPILFLIFVFNQQIFGFLSVILESYTRFNISMTATGAYLMIILFVLFAIYAFVIPEEKLLDNETVGLRNFLLLSVALQMFAPLHTVAMRMNYYYIIFIPLLIPKIIKYRSKKWYKIAHISRYVMIIVFMLYFFITISINKPLNMVPYQFFWENA